MVLAKRYCVTYIDGTTDCGFRDGFWYTQVSPSATAWLVVTVRTDSMTDGHNSQVVDTSGYLHLLHGVVRRRISACKVSLAEGLTTDGLPSSAYSFMPTLLLIHILTDSIVAGVLF
jgi:hypothetical protein